MSDNNNARRTLRGWAKRFRKLGHGPSPKAMAAIKSSMVASTVSRMRKGIAPDGSSHKRLSKEWIEEKRAAGHSERIWQNTSESLRKVRAFVRGAMVRITIDTPYSAYANAVRRVVGLSEQDVSRIDAVLSKDFHALTEGDAGG